MKLYNTDYLLKKKEGEFERFGSGDYIIYSSACRVDEVMIEGDLWVKTTDLEPKIKNELINQLKDNKIINDIYNILKNKKGVINESKNIE